MKLPPDEIKAWSQNLGREKLDTSVNSYGNVSLEQQRANMLGMHVEQCASTANSSIDLDLLSSLVKMAVKDALKT